MLSLYVYYRVSPEQHAQRLAQWQALNRALAERGGPTGQRQQRRDDASTWMEVYPDLPAGFEAAYRQALAAVDGDGQWQACRHEEWFVDSTEND